MGASLEAEVEDLVTKGDVVEVLTLPENYHSALQAFEDQELEVAESAVEFLPVQEKELSDEATYCLKLLLYRLEEIEDVQGVYHNGILKEGIELKYSNYGVPFSYERAMGGRAVWTK